MFGYIGSPCSGCQAGAARTYRAFFCGLCNRLRGDYGLPARFLVNRDSTFLSIFSAAQMAEPPGVSVSTCCNPLGRKREHFETGSAVTFASAVTVFGLETKLRDNSEDESGWKRTAAQGLLSGAQGAFDRARTTLTGYGVDPSKMDEKFGEQLEREHAFASGSHDIDLITTPTSWAYSNILARTTSLPGTSATALPVPLVEQFGHQFGALVYLLDAVLDHDRDRKSGAFNPVHHVGLPVLSDATWGRVDSLESAATQLQTGLIHFGDLFGQLAGSLRATAESVLDPESNSPDQKKKRRKKSNDRDSWDCCDCYCCDCCDCCQCCGKGKGKGGSDGCDCNCPCPCCCCGD